MRRHLPLLLLLYLALDFANPLMPGAVRFEAGSVEIVQADRTARAARPAAAPARLVAALPTVSVLPGDAMLDRPARVPPLASILALRTARRAPPPRVTPPPSSSEDH
jgi:hypothetical protein